MQALLLSNNNNLQVLKPKYQVGDIVIPSDITLFNQMWLNKEFDKINPADLIHVCTPTLYRETNGIQTWDTTFFARRQSLLHQSASSLWKHSTFSRNLVREVQRLIYTSNPLLDEGIEILFSDTSVTDYLSRPPEELMFCEKKQIVYMHPAILPIYRDLISRFQLLANKMNDERISIYLDELQIVSQKISFIQTLCYYGIDIAVLRFKKFKPNFLVDDPEVSEIMSEPISAEECFWKKSFKHVLHDFYSLCVSPEIITKENTERIYFIGKTIINYEDIRTLVTKYLLPMRSSIRQAKLHTICSQVVLSYLQPVCITEQYIVNQLTRF